MSRLLAVIAGIAALALSGCKSSTTGMVLVDREAAEASNLEITDFHDNPFYAYVEYDYKRIKDFDPKKLKVTLEKNVYPDVDWYDIARMYRTDTEPVYFMMKAASLEGHPKEHASARAAHIVENKPGYLKILSLDDIGTYVISYD